VVSAVLRELPFSALARLSEISRKDANLPVGRQGRRVLRNVKINNTLCEIFAPLRELPFGL